MDEVPIYNGVMFELGFDPLDPNDPIHREYFAACELYDETVAGLESLIHA